MTTVSATVARAGLAGLLLAALPGLLGSIVAADDWQDGRGSFYGNAGSGWSIHRGARARRGGFPPSAYDCSISPAVPPCGARHRAMA